MLFLKPPSALARADGGRARVDLPRGRGAVHHECEIVLRLGAGGEITAVTLGLDLTLREVQARLKRAGHPWELSKVFAGSAVVGPWLPVADFPDYAAVPFSFALDGRARQRGTGSEMLLGPDACVAYAREQFPLRDGDLLFTGTPAGVGPIEPGQEGELVWGERLRFRVAFQ